MTSQSTLLLFETIVEGYIIFFICGYFFYRTMKKDADSSKNLLSAIYAFFIGLVTIICLGFFILRSTI